MATSVTVISVPLTPPVVVVDFDGDDRATIYADPSVSDTQIEFVRLGIEMDIHTTGIPPTTHTVPHQPGAYRCSGRRTHPGRS